MRLLYLCLANRINHLPHSPVETSFKEWESTYHFHIYNLFLIFAQHLSSVEPFDKDYFIESKDKYLVFAKMLYKRSSRVV